MPKLVPPVVDAASMSDLDQPTIVLDETLALRPWRSDDAPAVVAAFTTPDIQRWHFRRYETIAEAEAWIEENLDGWRRGVLASWAIADGTADRAAERVVGRVAIHCHLEDGWGEIGYWILPDARGRAVAPRAAVAATAWAHRLGLNRVELQHSTDNEASGRVARKAGFTVEGIRRGANLHDDGWHDMALYSHLAGEPFGPL